MTTITPLQLLQSARDRIADPAHWTRETYARDRRGIAVFAAEPTAVSFCALGVLISLRNHSWTTQMNTSFEAENLLLDAACARGWDTIVRANDIGGHAEVLAIYDAVIARLEEEQAAAIPAPLFATPITVPESVTVATSSMVD